jgi:hypothetical protein
MKKTTNEFKANKNNEGTESTCSPHPTGRRGPQLEPMLKQILNLLSLRPRFLFFCVFRVSAFLK